MMALFGNGWNAPEATYHIDLHDVIYRWGENLFMVDIKDGMTMVYMDTVGVITISASPTAYAFFLPLMDGEYRAGAG